MMEAVALILPSVLAVVVVGGVWTLRARSSAPSWLIVTLAYFVFDALAVHYRPHVDGLHWNWTGKLDAIVLSLLVAVALRLSRVELGMILPRGPRAWRWTALGIAVAVVVHSAVNFVARDGHSRSLETLLFQATMPGLSEELAYRGVAFAMLLRAFPGRVTPAIVITSVEFGLVHGLSASGDSLAFDVGPFLWTGLMGAWFALMRARTGSLLGGIVAHNGANTMGELMASR